MSQETHSLLDGPLKHVRAAALAAALVPLASVAATPAEAQDSCFASAGICGFVWVDDGDGIQETGEVGIGNVSVTVTGPAGSETRTVSTDANGFYDFIDYPFIEGESYVISVMIPPGAQPTTPDAFDDTQDTVDSDGVADGENSNVTVIGTFSGTGNPTVDFGFTPTTTATNPGTGTPGYWMNHPDAWPVGSITIGATMYSKAQLIALMQAPVAKDKTYTMISSYVAAYLNVLIGNDPSCVQGKIDEAAAWLATYPVGSKVAASSPAWKVGEPIHRHLDNYNNGMYCAPHRD